MTKFFFPRGPGVPVDAGICIDIIKRYASTKSILGICLGHQAIGEAFGGKLLNRSSVYHGIATPVMITELDDPLFVNIPSSFIAEDITHGVVSAYDLPDCFNITCKDEDGIIIGFKHKEYDVRGLQFHPESVLTEHGMRLWITGSIIRYR